GQESADGSWSSFECIRYPHVERNHGHLNTEPGHEHYDGNQSEGSRVPCESSKRTRDCWETGRPGYPERQRYGEDEQGGRESGHYEEFDRCLVRRSEERRVGNECISGT